MLYACAQDKIIYVAYSGNHTAMRIFHELSYDECLGPDCKPNPPKPSTEQRMASLFESVRLQKVEEYIARNFCAQGWLVTLIISASGDHIVSHATGHEPCLGKNCKHRVEILPTCPEGHEALSVTIGSYRTIFCKHKLPNEGHISLRGNNYAEVKRQWTALMVTEADNQTGG